MKNRRIFAFAFGREQRFSQKRKLRTLKQMEN